MRLESLIIIEAALIIHMCDSQSLKEVLRWHSSIHSTGASPLILMEEESKNFGKFTMLFYFKAQNLLYLGVRKFNLAEV